MNERTILNLLKQNRYKRIAYITKGYWGCYGVLRKENLEENDLEEIAKQLFEESAVVSDKEYDDIIVFFDKDLEEIAHTEHNYLFKTPEGIAIVIEDITYHAHFTNEKYFSCNLHWFDKKASEVVFSHDWQYLVGELVRFDSQDFCDAYKDRN